MMTSNESDGESDALSGSAMNLNYSKEDVEVLIDEAEKLVMDQHKNHLLLAPMCENCYAAKTDSHSRVDYSSDSDYETKVSREWIVQSEPNIHLHRISPLNPTRRRKPNAQRRGDWRHSLPECLEYFNKSESDEGRESQASLPLSDLWEHDQFITEEQEDQCLKKDTLPSNLENFGEDYSKYLYSDTETDSELEFSDEQNDDDDDQETANYKILQSKSELKTILTQINTKDDIQFEQLKTKLVSDFFNFSHDQNNFSSITGRSTGSVYEE